MKLLLTGAAVAAMTFTPAAAHAQLFGGFGNSSTGSTLLGAGAGAGIGALIAGSGNNVEGALLGAALGGVAGNAFAPRPQSQFNGPQGGFPVQQGYAQQGYPVQQGGYAPQYVNSGQYVSGQVVPVTRYIQPVQHIQPVYVQRTVYVQRPSPAPVVQRVVVRAPQIANCPSNTTRQADGTCLDRNVTRYNSPVEQRSTSSRNEPCPADSRKQGDGTCLSSMVTHIDRTAYVAPAPQPVQQQVWVQQPQPVQTIAPAPAQVYCYNGGSTQYDQWGHAVSNGGNVSNGHQAQCRN